MIPMTPDGKPTPALLTKAARVELLYSDILMASLLVIPAFAADNNWTNEERSQIRDTLILSMSALSLNIDTMSELRTTAGAVLERLAAITG